MTAVLPDTRTAVSAGTSVDGPLGRDRTIDALRAVAILGVVLGHWLVTALVSVPGSPAELHAESPLGYLPGLAPVSWLVQLLGPFFFVGGYANAVSAGRAPAYPAWIWRRLARLARPVLLLAAVWVPAGLLLTAVAAPASTRHVVASAVTQPLWFLGVYAVLTALTPVARAAVARVGVAAALVPLLVVAGADLLRPGVPGSYLALLAGWLVPYLLGIAFATGRLGPPTEFGEMERRPAAARRGRPAVGWWLLAGGVLAGAALVLLAGYPASAVGIPGAARSNLNPPSLFAVALGVAQIGAFLLVRPSLDRILRRTRVWSLVVVVNLRAMTVYC